MKTFENLLSVGTVIPLLLVSGPGRAEPVLSGFVVAQIAPAEDPNRRPPQEGGGETIRPAHPAAPPAPNRPAPPPPAEHRAPPPAEHRAPPPPAAERPPAPPAVHAAPPPVHVAPPAEPRAVAPPPPQVHRPEAPPAVVEPARPAPVAPAPAPHAPIAPSAPAVRAPEPPRPAPETIAPQRRPEGGAMPAPVERGPQGERPRPPAPTGLAPVPPPPPQAGAPRGEPMPPRGEAMPPREPERRSGVGAAVGAAAAGAAVGIVGGMILDGHARSLEEVHRDRRETVRDGATFYSEPGRVIVRDGDGLRVRHDEAERFRALGGPVTRERRGDETWDVWQRPDGTRIVTVVDEDGRLIRRIRRWPDGREEILIDDGPRRPSYRSEVVVLPPPPVPRERWSVDSADVDEGVIYDTLDAPPLAPLPRRYSLDQIRSSRDLRAYMPAVDVDTVTFATGSWSVEPDQVSRLSILARSMERVLARNPDEIFLVEGHTDAVGSDVDNLSLSDRRAQSVADVLTREFGIPAENLVTQGYGEQFLKEQTEGPSRINRRVTIRRITPLLERTAR